jgi:hypothetical protein
MTPQAIKCVMMRAGEVEQRSPERGSLSMGDKSPKAKNKAKKQDTQEKSQKKAAADAKATKGSSAQGGKKGN